MAMLHSDNAYSHTEGRFGYSDADWKFNMGTKARNAFWMSENKQTTYLLKTSISNPDSLFTKVTLYHKFNEDS
jgi:hypothetical protein